MSTIKKPHWECGESVCRFRAGKKLWGVVIQRITCNGHSSQTKFCFRWLRFMDGKDGNQNNHTDFHEVFWAYYSGTAWTLSSRLNIANDIGPQKTLSTYEYPPAQLPPASEIFELPTKFKTIGF